MHFSSNDHCHDLLYNFPCGNLHVPTVPVTSSMTSLDQSIFPKMVCQAQMAHSGGKRSISLKWSISTNCLLSNPHWFSCLPMALWEPLLSQTLLRGSSCNGPMPVWCLLRCGHSQLFSERHCFDLHFPNIGPSKSGAMVWQHCCHSCSF